MKMTACQGRCKAVTVEAETQLRMEERAACNSSCPVAGRAVEQQLMEERAACTCSCLDVRCEVEA